MGVGGQNSSISLNGFFFSANSITGLAAKIRMKYQRVPMPAERLAATVARYNAFVDPREGMLTSASRSRATRSPTPPFYAAWATPVPHDTRAGLRINADCQVIDMQGAIIPGLYCGGETAGGFSQHGLARCVVQGLIAGGQRRSRD